MPKLTIEGSNWELSSVLIYLEGLQNGNNKVEAPQKAAPATDKQNKPKPTRNPSKKDDAAKPADKKPTKVEEPAEPKVEPKPEPKPEHVEAEVVPPATDEGDKEAKDITATEMQLSLATLATAFKAVGAKKGTPIYDEMLGMLTPYKGLQNVPEDKWQEYYDWAVSHRA